MNKKKFKIVGGIAGVIYSLFTLYDIINEKPDENKKKWWQF